MEFIEMYIVDPIKQRKKAIEINRWLAVASSIVSGYKIYRIDTGKPVINVKFVNSDDAVKMANMLDDIFGEYFDIWGTYPDANVFSLAKWVGRNGLKAHEMIKIIEEQGKVQTNDQLDEAWENADETQWFGQTSRPAWG